MADRQLLSELLNEDQEPFQLRSYIEQRRSQFRETTLQVRKRKPIILENTTKRTNLCKQACFFSFQNSPDVTKSPFHDFYSPCKSPNGAVFFHIPAGTAALLAEAAMKIQKQKPKPKAQIKNVGFGLFASILKRLKDRNKSKKRAIGVKNEAKIEKDENKISCSCNNSRISSAGWSEFNEEKSIGLETSTSSCTRSEDWEIINDGIVSCENRFCISPFRFSLQASPSFSGHRTPEFSSPTTSPICRKKQEKEKDETKNKNDVKGEEADEKEQCSPVSILDAPFEDEEDEHGSEDADEDDCNLDCCYASVQRKKQQLLYRLRRFEKLAELDPMELERKLLEESSDDDYEDELEERDEPLSLYKERSVDKFVTEVFNQSSFQNSRKITADMTRLVSDLISEEKREMNFWSNKDVVLGRVCRRLDSWREVEFDTIDMMIELDLKKELDGWKKFHDQGEEIVGEVEVAIFGLLIDELSKDLFRRPPLDFAIRQRQDSHIQYC